VVVCGRAAEEPIRIKAVIVVTYEEGKYTGDKAGGMQPWAEGERLNRVVTVPGAFRGDIVMNENGVIGLVSGRGPINGAASVMALGLDPRFDFTRSYWFLTALTGFDPNDASLGSAMWGDWIVDGDWAHEVDARELPKDWTTTYFPVHSDSPDRIPGARGSTELLAVREAYKLNPQLAEWAYQLTKNVSLTDTPAMAKYRARFVGFSNAQKPPFVLKVSNVAAGTYWHGRYMTEWANRWVKLWTNGQGNFVSTSTPDGGRIGALTALGRAGKVDPQRILQLHAAMNFSMQPPDMTALESVTYDTPERPHPGMAPALENSYAVGSVVLHAILKDWDRYRDKLPGTAK
ncbi:MAG: purine nucleoside permease, partial [Opitutus sp.]